MNKNLIATLLWLILPFYAIAQGQDYAGEDKMICPGGTTKIGKPSSCELCCYKWSPTIGLDDPSKPNPTVSGLSESLIYSVTVSLPNGNFEVDYVTVYVYTSKIDIFKPHFTYTNNAQGPDVMIPENNQKIPGAQTMVNIDNDDCDGAFDMDDDVVESGDDEFVKIRVQLSIDLPGFAAQAPLGAEKSPPPLQYKAILELLSGSNSNGVRFWRSNDKAAGEYFLGQAIDLEPAGGTIYEGFIWAEGVGGHTGPQQTKLKVKAFGDTGDCPNNDYVSLTVIAINEIIWEGDGNGYTGDGQNNNDVLDEITVNGITTKRVFAESKYQGGTLTALRNNVKVKVVFSTDLVSNLKLVIRAFDIDDPSDDLTFIDPNDGGTSGIYAGGTGMTYNQDEDNRGKIASHIAPDNRVYGVVYKNYTEGACIDEALGIFSLSVPSGTGEYYHNFKVSSSPGDNYRLAMYGDLDFLKKLRNEDQYDHHKIVDMTTGSASSCLEMVNEYTSQILTEYRTLHIEYDAMKKADDNPGNENEDVRNAYFSDFELLPGSNEKIDFVQNIRDIGNNSIIPLDDVVGNGRFRAGGVKIGDKGFLKASVSNTIPGRIEFGFEMNYPTFDGMTCTLKKFVIPPPPNPPAPLILKVKRITKDLSNSNPYLVELDMPNNQLPAYDGSKVFLGGDILFSGFLQNPIGNKFFRLGQVKIPVGMVDDDELNTYTPSTEAKGVIKTAYDEAFIDAVFDGGGSLSNNSNNLSFVKNLLEDDPMTPDIDELVNQISSYYSNDIANAKLLENDNYWVANLIFGWQGPLNSDCDPDSEPSFFGGTPGEYPVEAHCNVTNGLDLSFLCIETRRDFVEANEVEYKIGYLAAHEIGHQFGLTHGFDGVISPSNPCADCIVDCTMVGLMTVSSMGELSDKFIEAHKNLLRSRKKSPKK